MEKIKVIPPSVKSNLRYKLCASLMNEFLLVWLGLPQTQKLVKKLISDCGKSGITLSAPSPLFVNILKNSLSNSQIAASRMIPPVSPNSISVTSLHANARWGYEGNEERRKESPVNSNTNSMTNSMMTSMKLSRIPRFFFGESSPESVIAENEEIERVFGGRKALSEEELGTVARELYGFPTVFSGVLYDKIKGINKDTNNNKDGKDNKDNKDNKSGKDNKGKKENTEKISKKEFIKYHIENFRGCSTVKRFFNFIKSPSRKEIVREDFKPFLRALLDRNPSLEFLKEHPTYQIKYSDTVIIRIFYVNDANDDGKITLHDFKRSDLVDVLIRVADEDVNNVRQYFSYEHFYVTYCIFFELDSRRERDPEQELFLDRQSFARHDAYALSKKAVERIFQQVPRKFVSGKKDLMAFEDFLWYLLSEEDKTTKTGIKYWFKVLDLDDNGILTPSELKFFFAEQESRLESNQSELVSFEDILCQLNDLIPPKKPHQWTLKDFIDNPRATSTIFNALLNLNKFVENEQKDPFNMSDVDKMPDFSDWDKFAYTEYMKKMSEENEDPEDEEPVIDSNDEENN